MQKQSKKVNSVYLNSCFRTFLFKKSLGMEYEIHNSFKSSEHLFAFLSR